MLIQIGIFIMADKKDKIAQIRNIEVPPNFYALFNASNIEMFKHEFKSLEKNDQKQAIELYEKMLRMRKAVLAEMKGMMNG